MISLAQYQSKIEGRFPEGMLIPDYLIPALVGEWGSLAAVSATAIGANWDEATTQGMTQDAYQNLADLTARLLALFSVEAVGGDEVASVSSKLSKLVDPLVAISNRVDRLYRAYRDGELDRVRYEASLLWVTLDTRSKAITGAPFEAVLAG